MYQKKKDPTAEEKKEEGMENWTEEQLREAVEKKHGKEKNKVSFFDLKRKCESLKIKWNFLGNYNRQNLQRVYQGCWVKEVWLVLGVSRCQIGKGLQISSRVTRR